MMKALIAVVLMAQPVAAECFVGTPSAVTYSSGSVMSVLDRKGDNVTVQWTRADRGASVQTTRLSLFTLEIREDGKTRRTKWKGPLPRLADLVPGYEYDISGLSEMTSGLKEIVQVTGRVSAKETVMVDNCNYETTVIDEDFSQNGEWMWHTKTYLRTDMMVVLRSETYFSGGDTAPNIVVALQ